MTRVVADQLDDSRLEEVYRIGVDEVSYRKGHRYLTVIADHDRDGAVIWTARSRHPERPSSANDQRPPLRGAEGHRRSQARSRLR